METATATYQLPTGNDIPESGAQTWRIADGKIVKGSVNLGTFEEMPGNKVLGQVLRFGVQTGEDKQTGKTWKQLEVDLATGQGQLRVKVNYNGEQGVWPTQGVGLAKYLASLRVDDIIVIEARRSDEPNKYGKHTTFVNVERWNAQFNRREKIMTDWDGEKFANIVDDVFEALENHPNYKVRVPEEQKSELDFFIEELQKRQWGELPASSFLSWVNKTAETEFTELTDMDDDWWNWARLQIADLTECPWATAPAKKAPPKPPKSPSAKSAPAPEPTDDPAFDPFSDD